MAFSEIPSEAPARHAIATEVTGLTDLTDLTDLTGLIGHQAE